MTSAAPHIATLEEFLKLPETKPASEYIHGEILQKPMPKGRHSRLQGKLCATVNAISESLKIAYAFPELRCTFGGRSVVPDIAVFQWHQIPFNATGEIPDNFALAPDWTIEILSPEQKPNKLIDNILHCLQFGCQLGWFIDPDGLTMLVFLPNQQPCLLQDDDRLPVLRSLQLELTVAELFSWLKMNG
jgi:Uma2 family endonuclease